MRRFLAAIAVLSLAAGCTPRGPSATLDDYVHALEAGRLDRAYALTSKAYQKRVDRAAFGKRYATKGARDGAAKALRAAAPGLVVVAQADPSAPLLEREGTGWAVVPSPAAKPPPPADAAKKARDVVVAFTAAAKAGDFSKAYALLAGPLRARYSPKRLAKDFQVAGAAAKGTLARIEAALSGGAKVVVEGRRAYLPLGGGLAVRLEAEDGLFRITALR